MTLKVKLNVFVITNGYEFQEKDIRELLLVARGIGMGPVSQKPLSSARETATLELAKSPMVPRPNASLLVGLNWWF